jgi:DNA-nicking Smr family endonuclease
MTNNSDDMTLWQRVVATVRPLKTPVFMGLETKQAPPPKKNKTIKEAPLHKDAVQIKHAVPGHDKNRAPDSHWARRIKTGEMAVEAAVDLHGLTQQRAHERLKTFLWQAKAKKYRLILVITGKGGGILQREVPGWLEAAPLMDLVTFYHVAHPKDGGAGALYVALRK